MPDACASADTMRFGFSCFFDFNGNSSKRKIMQLRCTSRKCNSLTYHQRQRWPFASARQWHWFASESNNKTNISISSLWNHPLNHQKGSLTYNSIWFQFDFTISIIIAVGGCFRIVTHWCGGLFMVNVWTAAVTIYLSIAPVFFGELCTSIHTRPVDRWHFVCALFIRSISPRKTVSDVCNVERTCTNVSMSETGMDT